MSTTLTPEEQYAIYDWLRVHRPEFVVPHAMRGKRTVIHVRTTTPRDQHGEPFGDLYPRETHTALDYEAHRSCLATAQAPGLPINGRRRRRKNLLTAVVDAITNALP